MYTHGFHNNPPLPLDLSGKTIKFAGRDDDERELEWYKASVKENGSLLVSYNSHHSSLKKDIHYVFNSGANKPQNEAELNAQKARVAAMPQKRQEEQIVKEKERKEKAKRDRDRFSQASTEGQSTYLTRKRVGTHGIRFE